MEGIRKSLQITLENCEFAKEFHYFLTVQLDGEGEKVKPILLNLLSYREGQMCQQQSLTRFSQLTLSTCPSSSTS
jgi:hypothetical protein